MPKFVYRGDKRNRTHRRRCAERNDVWNTAACARVVGCALHLDRSILSTGDVADLGTKKLIEQRISSRANRPHAVHDQDAFHSEFRGDCGSDARVIGLNRAGRDERVRAGRFRVRRNKPQLSNLVPAKCEGNRVIAFDEQSRGTSKHAAKMRKLLAWRRRVGERKGRRQRKRLEHGCSV